MTEIDAESLARERAEGERRENERDLDAVDGAVVLVYTRAQAIEDGILIDVTPTAREAGLTLPTVVTRHVWAECVEVPASLKGRQDEAGRLWDVVSMASMALRAAARAREHGDRAQAPLARTGGPTPPPDAIPLRTWLWVSESVPSRLTYPIPGGRRICSDNRSL